MASSLETISEILKAVYLGPSRFVDVPRKSWTCSQHQQPNLDKYEERCQFDPDCREWECPHKYSVKVADGCPECKTSEYEPVLDNKGEQIIDSVWMNSMQEEMNGTSILFDMLKSGKPITFRVEPGKPLPKSSSS